MAFVISDHFIISNTMEVISFGQLNALINNELSHIGYDHVVVDEYLTDSNPFNTAWDRFPILEYMERLWRNDEQPSHHMWQKLEFDTPVYNNTESRYEQDWKVVDIVVPELYLVNYQIAEAAKSYRISIQSIQVEHEGAYATATNEDVAALNGCIAGMLANKNETNLAWKGPLGHDSLPQWFTMAEIDIVENLYSIVFKRQQNAFRAEEYVTEKQRIAPYNSIGDMIADMYAKFDELQNPVES